MSHVMLWMASSGHFNAMGGHLEREVARTRPADVLRHADVCAADSTAATALVPRKAKAGRYPLGGNVSVGSNTEGHFETVRTFANNPQR